MYTNVNLSTFFWRRIGVGDDRRSRLAAAQGGAGGAPGARALMAVAGLVEHPPEGVGRDGGQAVYVVSAGNLGWEDAVKISETMLGFLKDTQPPSHYLYAR